MTIRNYFIESALGGCILAVALLGFNRPAWAVEPSQAGATQTTELRSSVTRQTANGDTVVIRSGMPLPQPSAAAPAFESLNVAGSGYIDEDAARAYPLLANDFIHADGNRDGRISKPEYLRWTAQL